MPLYDVSCPTDGISEIYRPMNDPADWSCPSCGGAVTRMFSPPAFKVEYMERIGQDRSGIGKGVNLGLPGVFTSLGKDATGKERFDYRPRYASEASSIRAAKEIAKRHDLTMVD